MFSFLSKLKNLFFNQSALSVVLAAVLLASCSTSSTIEIAGSESESQSVESGKSTSEEATVAESQNQDNDTSAQEEPTAEATATAVPTATAEPTATVEPTATPEPTVLIEESTTPEGTIEFHPEGILTANPASSFVLASSQPGISSLPECDSSNPTELLVVDLYDAALTDPAGDVIKAYPAGYQTNGPIVQALFDYGSEVDRQTVRLASQCVLNSDFVVVFHEIVVDGQGLVLESKEPLVFTDTTLGDGRIVDDFSEGDYKIFLIGDGPDGEVFHQVLSIDLETGAQTFLDGQGGLPPVQEFTWVSGRGDTDITFNYRARDVSDEIRSLFLVDENIEPIDDALDEFTGFSGQLCSMSFSIDGYVVWVVGDYFCIGYKSVFAGFLSPDGYIQEAHFIDAPALARSTSVERPDIDFSFTNEEEFFDAYLAEVDEYGFLYVLGSSQRDGETKAIMYVVDLYDDPSFLYGAPYDPEVARSPIYTDLHGSNWWVGEDRNQYEPGCGNQALYYESSRGLNRLTPPYQSIDAPVQVIASVPLETPDGQLQAVVVGTQCPEQYDGLRLWFGLDRNGVYIQLETFYPSDAYVDSVQWVQAEWYEEVGELRSLEVRAKLLDGTEGDVVVFTD